MSAPPGANRPVEVPSFRDAVRRLPEGSIRSRVSPAEVALLEQTCFAEPWTAADLSRILSNPAAGAWILEDAQGHAVGYLVYHRSQGEAELLRLGVRPEWRRRGCGTRLLRVFQAWCRQAGIHRVFLDVREDNREARRLYESGGFALVGRRRGYYSRPPGDALVLQWSGALDPSAPRGD
jgi:ribosomal-protein-alanine N-acetyltransferase